MEHDSGTSFGIGHSVACATAVDESGRLRGLARSQQAAEEGHRKEGSRHMCRFMSFGVGILSMLLAGDGHLLQAARPIRIDASRLGEVERQELAGDDGDRGRDPLGRQSRQQQGNVGHAKRLLLV
jgi:hypothetical protein